VIELRKAIQGSFFVLAAFIGMFACANVAYATSELVGYWRFDESSGNAVDSSGNLANLANNNVTYGVGKYGNAAYFNGTTAYFTGTGPNLNGQSFTFSAWLWREAGGGQEIYFSQGSGDGDNNNLHLRIYDDGLMRFGYLNNDLDAPAGTFAMGQWNYVVLTYDADTNARKIYLNGGAPKASDISASDFLGNTDLNIGRWIRNGGDQYWTGRIDDLKIYNRALTEAEVTAIAEGGAGPGLLDVDEVSPADNATRVAINANLVATFSTSTVATSTGSIGIYKTSDDSLVEAIAVTSSQLTKSGAAITINPSVTLANDTEYYVWIPSTAFKDADNVFYLGTTASTTWSFTTVADETAPAISDIATSSITNAGATIAWVTDEAASTQVAYSVDSSFASSTAEADTATRVTSHSKTLSGLLPCTWYNFKAVSADGAGNYATSTKNTFLTTGCAGDAIPSTLASTTVSVSSAATSTSSDSGRTLTVATPANFTATSSSIVIQIKGMDSATVLGSIGNPSSDLSSAASIAFDVTALIDNVTVLDSFDVPVTISYTYTDDDISGLDESTLAMYHYANGAWNELDDCSVDTAANTITCTAPHFSVFAIFGTAISSSENSSNVGGGTPPWCSGPLAPGWNTSLPDGGCGGSDATAVVAPTLCPAYPFTRALRFGMEGEDVRALQRLMNCLGFSLAESGPGSPGEETPFYVGRTRTAVIKFQEAYAHEILVPVGEERGTGIFAQYSRAKAHNLTSK
jgi:hypothetical protein